MKMGCPFSSICKYYADCHVAIDDYKKCKYLKSNDHLRTLRLEFAKGFIFGIVIAICILGMMGVVN